MFIVVFVFVLPIYALPIVMLIRVASSFNFSDWIQESIRVPGPSRTAAEQILLFVVMVVALFVPFKSFWGKHYTNPIAVHGSKAEKLDGSA
jgi:hypothetical protein